MLSSWIRTYVLLGWGKSSLGLICLKWLSYREASSIKQSLKHAFKQNPSRIKFLEICSVLNPNVSKILFSGNGFYLSIWQIFITLNITDIYVCGPYIRNRTIERIPWNLNCSTLDRQDNLIINIIIPVNIFFHFWDDELWLYKELFGWVSSSWLLLPQLYRSSLYLIWSNKTILKTKISCFLFFN